jgi:peptidoglycan/LPS O-acetylase OafA/YrhL
VTILQPEVFLQRIPPFRSLDALRGIAAAWVVMVHCCGRFLSGENLRYLNNPLYEFAIRGQLGVVFFFVISGYCITAAAHGALYSGKTLGRYAFERCRRIFPPYWVALALGVLALLLLHLAEAHHWIAKINHPQSLGSSPVYWIANLTLTQYEFNTDFANIVFWSLGCEIAFYFVVGVLLWLAKLVAKSRGIAAGQLTLIAGLALCTFATLLAMTISGVENPVWGLWHQFAFGGLLFYLIESKPGTVAGYSPRLRWILNGIAIATVALSVVFMALRRLGMADLSHPSSRIRTAVCLLFCVFLACLRPFDKQFAESRWMHPLLWLGASSYSLYLIHPVVLPFIDVMCRKAGLDGGRYWIAFWIQFAVAIVFGRLFYWVVERHFVSARQTKRLVEEHAV